MPHNRYYIDTSFHENDTVRLIEDEFHHLTRVSRSRIGDLVELVNGRGQLAQASITALNKCEAMLHLLCVTGDHQQKPTLILAQGLTRMNHLEWIIEKGTELNATAFWLFPGHLSEKETLTQTQTARLNNLAVSAMKQCGRLDLPSIELKPPLSQWTPIPGTLLYGDTGEQAPYLWDLNLKAPLPSPIVLFIGPESGFDPKERDFLQNSLKANGIRLHSNILRAETASLTAFSLIQQYIN